MGSPISPILADIVMMDLEDNCLNKLCFKPIFYKRYYFIINVDVMLDCFDSYRPRLQFTFGTELDKTINFLDTKIIRKSNGLVFDWYIIKPSFSGRFIDFYSSDPKCHEVGLIWHFVDKVVKFSDKEFHEKNLDIVKKILYDNNFPEKFVLGHMKRRLFNINRNSNNLTELSRNFTEALYANCEGFPYDYKIFLSQMCCTEDDENCMLNNCLGCQFDSQVFLSTDINLQASIPVQQWKNVDGFLQVIEENISVKDVIDRLYKEIPDFEKHCFIKEVQSNCFEAWENLAENEDVVV